MMRALLHVHVHTCVQPIDAHYDTYVHTALTYMHTHSTCTYTLRCCMCACVCVPYYHCDAIMQHTYCICIDARSNVC